KKKAKDSAGLID
ncbi:unnamed protein product, partial [Allacma fusca]